MVEEPLVEAKPLSVYRLVQTVPIQDGAFKSFEVIGIRDMFSGGRFPKRGEFRKLHAASLAYACGKLRAEITFGAEVVVDHVQKDRETLLVGSLDENFEILRASVAAVRGKEQDSVIAPVSFTRKVGNRHELNGRDAKIYKVVQI